MTTIEAQTFVQETRISSHNRKKKETFGIQIWQTIITLEPSLTFFKQLTLRHRTKASRH